MSKVRRSKKKYTAGIVLRNEKEEVKKSTGKKSVDSYSELVTTLRNSNLSKKDTISFWGLHHDLFPSLRRE